MMNRLILGLLALLASCVHTAPPTKTVTYTVGQPYQVGGEWIYPQEFNAYDATGVAVTATSGSADPYTADNESFDPNALAAASPVLPLPSIVTVTDLVTGRSVDVRVNDRGPAMPGRVIAVTPRVAQLLGFPGSGRVEVEVTLNTIESGTLSTGLGAGPKLTAAPVTGITAQALGTPGSAAGSAQAIGPASTTDSTGGVTLSGTVTQNPANPGPLFVRIPGFGTQDDAYTQMTRIPGLNTRVAPMPGTGRELWAVLVGPYYSVAEADKALQTLLSDGVTDPEIIVR